MNKRINTFETKIMKYAYLIAFGLCLLYFEMIMHFFGMKGFLILNLLVKFPSFIIELLKVSNSVSAVLASLFVMVLFIVIFIIFFLIFTFPFNIICLAYIKNKKRVLKESTTYKTIQDFDYFRDSLGDISPATISLVTDLKIENKKDFGATIMKLYQMKKIDFVNDEIIVLNASLDGLKRSEMFILDALISDKNSGTNTINSANNISLWNTICIDESIEEGFVENKRSKSKVMFKIIALIILFIGTIYICLNLEVNFNQKIPILEKYESGVSNKVVLNDPELFDSLIIIGKQTLFVINGIVTFILPLYILIYYVSSKVMAPKIRRTQKGKILIEQIAGMKNFIHDFSNLDEVTKEHIALWDHFLIYAIVLEENTDIVNNICNYKNVNLPKFIL